MINDSIRVPALVPSMPTAEELLPFLRRIEENKWYSNFGPLNLELSNTLAAYFGVDSKYLCTIANATLGLQAVSEAIEITRSVPCDMPSFTFTASASAIIQSGRIVRFLDIDEELRSVPSKSTKLLLDVLPFGDGLRQTDYECELDFVIIDGAASFYALENFGKTFRPSFKYAIVISLHATKLMGAGEGGIVISNDSSLISKIKSWQNFGFSSSLSNSRISISIGTNAKMSEYSSAVALASFERRDNINIQYSSALKRALSLSSKYGIKTHPAMQKGIPNPYWIVLLKDAIQMNELASLCIEKGIETRQWWQKGCHKMPAFSHVECFELVNTEFVADRYLGLPFHAFLDEKYWFEIEGIFRDISRGK